MRNKIFAWIGLLLCLSQVVLVLVSWVLTAAMPDDYARSLLSPEGIRWFFGRFVSNLSSPVLVWLLLGSIAFGAVHKSGVLHYDRSEYRQRVAMRLALFELTLFVLVMLLLILVPHAILLNVMGGLFPSSFSNSIIPYVCFAILVMSISYGLMSFRLKTKEDVFEAMAAGVGYLAPLFVVYVLASQLYHSILYLLT